MKSFRKAILYGIFLWLIPFIVAIAIYPIKENNYPFFETIMPVTLTICVVFFGVLYMKKLRGDYVGEGIRIGIIWFAVSFVIDLLMFSWGKMKMPFIEYLKDIGLTYLIYPTVTIGFGILTEIQSKPLMEREDAK